MRGVDMYDARFRTVWLTVTSLLSDITDVSYTGQSIGQKNRRTPLFHFAQFEYDIIDRELNRDLNCRSKRVGDEPAEPTSF